MDILIHILSGSATAAVIAAQTDFSTFRKIGLMILGGCAAAFPDIDAISLWSKFDTTIGTMLGLNHSGQQIYFGTFWYSHHGFFHSILAALLIATMYLLIRKVWFRNQDIKAYCLSATTRISFTVFFFAYLSHLMGDLPTPGGPWDGIRLFFPFHVYVGGWGYIWWWNNYDIFLGLLAANAFLIVLLLISNTKIPYVKKAAIIVYAACISLTCYSISNRTESFAYTGNTSRYNYYEKTARRNQLRILGRDLYIEMRLFDNNLPIHF